MAKLKLDLHDIYNRGKEIDSELNRIVQEAIERKIELVEITSTCWIGPSPSFMTAPLP